MKIEDLGVKVLISIVAALFGFFFGTYFANWVYSNYEAVVKGILGITLLVLMSRYILPKGLAKKTSRDWSITTNLKFVFLSVFWGTLGYWAIRELIDMIFYFTKLDGLN